jgi:AbiV family abortive infection protein
LNIILAGVSQAPVAVAQLESLDSTTRMKNVLEEMQVKLVAKKQLERLNRYVEIQNDLLAKNKSLVFASDFDGAQKQYARLVGHAEGLWEDACTLYQRKRFATALALSITCLEEIGKISVARVELGLKALAPQVLQSLPRTSTIRKQNPFYSHTQKLLLAAGAGSLINARLDRILGMPAVIAFLDDVESGKIEPLRQSCLYSDAEAGQLLLPTEQVRPERARFFTVLSGEVLAEVAGFPASEWERLIVRVQGFEKQIGHPYE